MLYHTRHFYILKPPAISDILCKIFNESFIDGVFPNHMKIAMVTQSYKGGSELCVCNYRSVSVIPILSKTLEKPVLSRLVDFLEEKEIIFEHQLGSQKCQQH